MVRTMNLKKGIPRDLNAHIDAYITDLSHCLAKLDRGQVARAIGILTAAYNANRKVFIIGNGGSATNASHLACDLSKGTLSRVYDENEKRMKVYSLTDNVAVLTAYANDVSYEEVFIQQLRNLVEPGDVVIILSGSGNSPNLVRAVEYARRCRAKTIGFLGFKTGGKIGALVDVPVIANSMAYGPSEDLQLILDHIITSWLSKAKSAGVKNK